MDASWLYGGALLFLSSALCSSAGVGGGSLNVPILYSIMGFDYDVAVILSLCALMGNYLLQVLINLDKRHPTSPTTPLIYWDAVLVLLPAELGGANLGIIASKAMPKSVVFILAMAVLVVAVYFSTCKALHLYEDETKAIGFEEECYRMDYGGDWGQGGQEGWGQGQGEGDEWGLDDSQGVDVYAMGRTVGMGTGAGAGTDVGADKGTGAGGRGEGANSPLLTSPSPSKSRPTKGVTIASILPPYLCCYYSLCRACKPRSDTYTHLDKDGYRDKHRDGDMRGNGNRNGNRDRDGDKHSDGDEIGNGGREDGEDKPPILVPWRVVQVVLGIWALYVSCYVVQKQFSVCALGNYICLGIMYVLLLLQVQWGLRYLAERQSRKPQATAEGDIDWAKQSVLMPVTSFLIGVTSALLGIGGGELMGPMMLMAKVLAPVSSATTSLMSLLNTSSSVIHVLVLGDLPYLPGLAVLIIGALGGITGRVGALFFVAHTQRASLLIFALIVVISCSILIYLYYAVFQKPDFELSALC